MLTIETERRVSKFFSTLLNYELLSQKAKNELISNELFNPYQCFKAIDKNNKRKIDPYDIVSFMKKNREHCTLHEASFIILFSDPEQSQYFSYPNFLSFLLSNFTSSTNIEYFKTYQTENFPVELLDNSVEMLLVNIFKAELNLIRSTEIVLREAQKRYDFNITDMFNAITGGSNISVNTLRTFLVRNGLYYKDEEIGAIINRLGIDKNGRVSLYEIKRIFELGYSLNISKEIRESKLKFPDGNLNVGFEKNAPNKSLPFDKWIASQTTKTFDNSSLTLKQPSKQTTSTYGDNVIPSSNLDYSLINNSTSFQEKSNYEQEISEEKFFISFFKLLLESESAIEKAKSELALRSDFNVEDAYRIFESNELGYLTESDLLYGFNALSLTMTEKGIKLFMNKYDLVNEGVLSFSNFFDMVVPFTKQYRDMIEARLDMNYTPKYNKIDVFLSSTLLYFQNLIRIIYNTEEMIDKQRHDLSPMSKIFMNNIFRKIDKDNKGYITPFDVRLLFNLNENS